MGIECQSDKEIEELRKRFGEVQYETFDTDKMKIAISEYEDLLENIKFLSGARVQPA